MAHSIMELDKVKKQYPVYGPFGRFLLLVRFIKVLKDGSF